MRKLRVGVHWAALQHVHALKLLKGCFRPRSFHGRWKDFQSRRFLGVQARSSKMVKDYGLSSVEGDGNVMTEVAPAFALKNPHSVQPRASHPPVTPHRH
jgi:hypothetical protein